MKEISNSIGLAINRCRGKNHRGVKEESTIVFRTSIWRLIEDLSRYYIQIKSEPL